MRVKTVLFGSTFFSVAVFEKLIQGAKEAGIEIIAVVTNRDALVGRKQELQENEVKTFAKNHNIPVYIFDKMIIERLKELKPDLCITASFGKLLKQDLLDVPKYGFLNVHGSLLPELRGAIPIQMGIFKELPISGVTILKTQAGLDDGPVLVKKAIQVESADTFFSLAQKIAEMGGNLLCQYIQSYVSGLSVLTPQEGEASYCYVRDIAQIEHCSFLDMPAHTIAAAIRALAPFSYPFITIQGINILLIAAISTQESIPGKPGDIVCIKKDNGKKIYLCCKEGALELQMLQPQNKKKMRAIDFWNGYVLSKHA